MHRLSRLQTTQRVSPVVARKGANDVSVVVKELTDRTPAWSAVFSNISLQSSFAVPQLATATQQHF